MSDKGWDYRVVRQTTEDGDEWRSVQEEYYDDETREIVRTRFLEDIDAFNYKF